MTAAPRSRRLFPGLFPVPEGRGGVFGGAWGAARFTRARLDPDLVWPDVLGLAALAGIGFTVSLLIRELAFPAGVLGEHVKATVLIGSLTSAVLAAALLHRRNRLHRRRSETNSNPSPTPNGP